MFTGSDLSRLGPREGASLSGFDTLRPAAEPPAASQAVAIARETDPSRRSVAGS